MRNSEECEVGLLWGLTADAHLSAAGSTCRLLRGVPKLSRGIASIVKRRLPLSGEAPLATHLITTRTSDGA